MTNTPTDKMITEWMVICEIYPQKTDHFPNQEPRKSSFPHKPDIRTDGQTDICR